LEALSDDIDSGEEGDQESRHRKRQGESEQRADPGADRGTEQVD
jgi:hypothetical protein